MDATADVSAASGGAVLADLGDRIFNDVNLSINRNQSCGSCHDVRFGYSSPLVAFNGHGAVVEGSIPGRFGNRRPPSAAYATFSPTLAFNAEDDAWEGGNFWDGRATGALLGNPAADQALGPFLNPAEQALPDNACVVYRVAEGRYAALYRATYGTSIFSITFPPAPSMKSLCGSEGNTVPLSAADRAKVNAEYNRIALAIAAFEASPKVNAFNSRFDQARAGGATLTKAEMQGFELFVGKANCAACHPSSGQRADAA